MSDPCCRHTGNPCGTDTWPEGLVCPCEPCQRWLARNPAPTEQARQRVVEAAGEIWSQAYRGTAGHASYVIHESFFRDLGKALKALNALATPAGKRPSEVERMARALWDRNRTLFNAEYGCLKPWEDEPEALRNDWRELAKAALAAIPPQDP